LFTQGLRIPVGVVVGGLDKVETAQRINERVVQVLMAAKADVTMTVLEGVGHLMLVEARRQLEEIVRNVSP
jgi:pimeloyl-ACP methyl ester carboxylesterase